MRTALVYDWLVGIGGGERVLQAIYEVYPSPIHTLIQDTKALEKTIFADTTIHSSFIQKLPFAKKSFRNFLPLFPLAIEQFDLSEYELVLSCSHAVAKGVLTHPHQLHICYCFTPMRYAWDLTHTYLNSLSGVKKEIVKLALHSLRKWDTASTSRVDVFGAISHYVARRIKKIYGRESCVIYPPVSTQKFSLSNQKEEYYITYSRLVPYKRVDLIVEAFSHMPQRKLIVIGDGPEMKKIKSLAGKNVDVLGFQSDETIRELVSKARAFIFAADEDFGIVAVEAQAAGIPVLAYGKGASLETIVADKTGLFFPKQEVADLCNAIEQFEKKEKKFDPKEIRKHAETFSEDRFKREFKQFVTKQLEDFHESSYPGRR